MNNTAKFEMAIYASPINIWYIQRKTRLSWALYPEYVQKYLIPMNINFKMSTAFTIMNNRELLLPREIIREEMFHRCFLAKANDLNVSTKRESSL